MKKKKRNNAEYCDRFETNEMQIVNFTQYSTRDLARIFKRDVKENIRREGKCRKLNYLYITVKYSKSGITGRVAGDTSWILMRLPRAKLNKKYVVIIFDHELMHVRGYQHSDMGSKMHLSEDCVQWVNKYELRKERACKHKKVKIFRSN